MFQCNPLVILVLCVAIHVQFACQILRQLSYGYYVFLPTAITTVASILLPIRFVLQKRTLQRLQWHRARKMIIHTIVISSAYIICWIPYTIVLQLSVNGILSFGNPNINLFLIYGPYFTSLLTPFIIQHTMPGWVNKELMGKIKRQFFPQRQSAIQPGTVLIAQERNGFTMEACK